MNRKPSVGAIVLALPMLFFGVLMFLSGRYEILEWRSESSALTACGVVWAGTGAAILVSALWVMGSLARNPMPFRIGGWAIVVSGIVLAMAAAINVLECASPT